MNGMDDVLRKRPRVALCWLHTWRPKEMATTMTRLTFVKREMRQIGLISLRAPKDRRSSAKTSVAKA